MLTVFDQGDLFYQTCNKPQLNSLQNKCLRAVYVCKNWPGTKLAHQQCKLILCEDRRKIALLKHAHLLAANPLNLKNQDPRRVEISG